MAQSHERECAVCTNDFTIPKILPCGHLLCRECLISWLDSKPEGGCPLCRCPIVEQSGRSSSETVDALPTDLVMEALVESARVLSKDHLCCVCEDVRADFICMQCQDMMCSACTKAHKKFSGTRGHDVESLSTVTPERLAASRPALCADHGDKQAEYFCDKHRLAVCTACKSNKHNECLEANILDNEIELAQNSLNDLTKILVEAEQTLEQAIGQLTSRLQEVDVSEQEDMAQVDKACDRLQKLVKDFCKKLKEKTRTSHLQIRNSLRDVKTDLNNRLGKVTSHKHIVTRATAVSPRPALIHMRQTLTDRVNSLDLSADLQREVWVKPLSISEWCDEVVGRIEQELLMWEQQKTESETQELRMWEQLKTERKTRSTPTDVVSNMSPCFPKPSTSAANRLTLNRLSLQIERSRKHFSAEMPTKERRLDAQPPVLVFHENCGTNIRLTNCNTTAEKIKTDVNHGGVFVSRDAMVANFLYEVRVDNVLREYGLLAEYSELYLGVTQISPAFLRVTQFSTDLKDSIIILSSDVCYQGKSELTTLGEGLERLQVRSRVGLLVDSSNDLHLYVNGHDQGVVPFPVRQPCFAVFSINSTVTKVTALPTSRRTYRI